jgi:hypothetical protein
MITGDALLVSYGFSQKLAGILFVASALPLLFASVLLQMTSAAARLIILALRLERKLMIRENSLAATYARTHLRPLVAGFASIEALSYDDLLSLSQNLSMRRLLSKRIPMLLFLATTAQITLAVVSLVIYHYRFM